MIRGRDVLQGPAGRSVAAVLSLLAAMPVSCGPPDPPTLPTTDPSSEGVNVLVSIPPQASFVERIGGDLVNVQVLLSPGQSPATYEPTPRQMVALGQAEVFFRIGVPFEKRLIDKIGSTLETLRIVDTREGITLRRMGRHQHGADCNHGHEAGVLDPHVWLDPRLVKIQARTICRTLSELDRAHSSQYERRLKAFETELEAVYERLSELLAPFKGREFFVFHPAYGYFADAFGLVQVAVEAGGKEPSQKNLVALIEEARRKDVRLIFVQPQFAGRSAEMIAEAIGGAVVPLDPLARDYLANLNEMALKIETALGDQVPRADTQQTAVGR